MDAIEVFVDSRLRLKGYLDDRFISALKNATTHSNPDFGKKKSMGHWTGDTPRRLTTWREEEDGAFSLPRGAMGRLREIADAQGVRLVFRDRRVNHLPFEWPRFVPDPKHPEEGMRGYQDRCHDACTAREQGIVRAATGSGKTHIALKTAGTFQRKACVIMRNQKLLEQWVKKLKKHFGMGPPMVGIVGGGKKTIGTHITLALQQALWAPGFPLHEFAQQFDVVMIDEVHLCAARTVQETIDVFPARVRLGFSADETRKDRKEFLIYDLFGEVLEEVTRAEVEDDGFTLPVTVRLVPTEFEADWYRDATAAERDFRRLIDEMTNNADRERLLRRVVLEIVAEGQHPALVFTHRREHAMNLELALVADRVPCGLMLGGKGKASRAFDEACELMEQDKLHVAVGTYEAIGTGIDIPNVMAGVASTPIGRNKQFFGQVRGRICRSSPSKHTAFLYYLWDWKVFPAMPRNLIEWNDGRVEIFDRSNDCWVRCDGRGDPID